MINMLVLHNDIELVPITAADEDFLCAVYTSARDEEMSLLTHWSEEEKKSFLEMQFRAQHSYYQEQYPTAFFWLVVKDQEMIGRLYLDPQFANNSVRIIDITLLPPWRNQGIGRQVLLDVMDYAKELNRSVTIHVESFNPAMHLYKRLGFSLVSVTNGVYHLMEWKQKEPAAQA